MKSFTIYYSPLTVTNFLRSNFVFQTFFRNSPKILRRDRISYRYENELQ